MSEQNKANEKSIDKVVDLEDIKLKKELENLKLTRQRLIKELKEFGC